MKIVIRTVILQFSFILLFGLVYLFLKSHFVRDPNYTINKKNNPEKYSASTNTKIGYWLNKGFDEETARKKISEKVKGLKLSEERKKALKIASSMTHGDSLTQLLATHFSSTPDLDLHCLRGF